MQFTTVLRTVSSLLVRDLPQKPFSLPDPLRARRYYWNRPFHLRINECRFSQRHLATKPQKVSYSKKFLQARISIAHKMAANNQDVEAKLAPLRASVKEQGDIVRSLKEKGANEFDVKAAILELKARKKKLEDEELKLVPADAGFQRVKMEDLLKRRFFIDQSFAIYGGVAGQFDFGPVGCAMKNNFINEWRQHFILEEHMLEVDCSTISPEPVLKASGHVDRFADLMVKDMKNGECFRLDHIIKAHLEKLLENKKLTDPDKRTEINTVLTRLDGYSKDEMAEVQRKFDIKSPITGNDLSEPIEFNLMFSTHIGPDGCKKGFLRPETAQGIFVNFKRLLEFNSGRLPFSAAQIGNAFRNEISPRNGLIRVREFTMAEIEHFVDPFEKDNFPKFSNVENVELILYSACNQMEGKSAERKKVGQAVSEKIIANKTLGYFMARIQLFLLKVGIDPTRLRFRQHMSNEMAHYASDCWDAECLTSYGWVECVGCADRSCYDLKKHSEATGHKLVAEKVLKEPRNVEITEIVPNMALLGKQFKQQAKEIAFKLKNLGENDVVSLESDILSQGQYKMVIGDGSTITLTKDMLSIKKATKTLHVEDIVPCVIEPSFGIGRILYSIWEHTYRVRDGDENRGFFALPPIISPLKCSVLPLSGHEKFVPHVARVSSDLTSASVSHKVDDSGGSIGRRYARTDEVAVPFGITIDFDTLREPHTATLRDRDSMEQVRIPLTDIAAVVGNLGTGKLEWADVAKTYPRFEGQQDGKEDAL